MTMTSKDLLKKKESGADGAFELEQQFILRLPQAAAVDLRQEVQSGSHLLKDYLSIEFDNDMRHGVVQINNYIFGGKLVDLPCIVESLKTLDKKTFYKTADICQMLICSADEEINVEDVESPKKRDKDKCFMFNHGIAAPLKNVRKRRFRKTLKKKYMDQPELEKEVRRLFRYDQEAIDVKWAVLAGDERSLPGAVQASGHIQSSGAFSGSIDGALHGESGNALDIASFFGELSSSDDDEDREQEDGDGLVYRYADSAEDDASHLADGNNADDFVELQEKQKELVLQLEEIREKRLELESQMFEEDNDLMQDRLREDLERFLQEEGEKEREINGWREKKR